MTIEQKYVLGILVLGGVIISVVILVAAARIQQSQKNNVTRGFRALSQREIELRTAAGIPD